MEYTKDHIDKDRLPVHIAIIMDGNGRWAKLHNKPRIFGHQNGVKAVREATEASAELGIKYLTMYAFSTENWNRPALEVNALMGLLVDTLAREIKTLNKNNIRLRAIGDLSRLPEKTYQALLKGIDNTSSNTGMTLILALNYSGRWDIAQAASKWAQSMVDLKGTFSTPDEAEFRNFLSTSEFPDPELLIRTSGESRISNFLLWQMAYTELVFMEKFWPDFRKDSLYEAIFIYQQRERRFGKTSEQIKVTK
jgi:undecaprenyl diphosphate synthase